MILLAALLGLSAGYLDLVMMVFKKYAWSDLRYFGSGRDFLWSIPIVHTALLFVSAVFLIAAGKVVPSRYFRRVGPFVLTTLALWSALLRAPLFGIASLLLAAGIASQISGPIVTHVVSNRRRGRLALVGLFTVLLVMAAATSGARLVREYRQLARLPAAPPGARNVVLIVWDTVRASSLSVHGYPRDTTPNLARWARTGVRYALALATAPWTLPSHGSIFTGAWPFEIDTQRTNVLKKSPITLAEHLASCGYQTVGFVGNTNYCSYESGLDRGFVHYEDYPLSPLDLLGRTVPGAWIKKNILNRGDFYADKWNRLQARDGRAINEAFLDWLPRRMAGRPFFAFLNYFDAHDPYLPPSEYAGRSGIRPASERDYRLLTDFAHLQGGVAVRDVVMARDGYDDCIAFLDDQLGRLLTELKVQGLLDTTVVVITSDHGESFGTHGRFGHGGSLYLDEVGVPLVILSPGAPANRVVNEPVSLRDLPATILDQVGLSAGSPFPGRSLASSWRPNPGQVAVKTTSPFSELAHPIAFDPQSGPGQRGVQMSLVALGYHFVRDGMGAERLFHLSRDPFEMTDQIKSADGLQVVGRLRKILLDLLSEGIASPEIEKAYMKKYKDELEATVTSRATSPDDVNTENGDRPAANRIGGSR
jgi:arylsulfatase A-like enzyme